MPFHPVYFSVSAFPVPINPDASAHQDKAAKPYSLKPKPPSAFPVRKVLLNHPAVLLYQNTMIPEYSASCSPQYIKRCFSFPALSKVLS